MNDDRQPSDNKTLAGYMREIDGFPSSRYRNAPLTASQYRSWELNVIIESHWRQRRKCQKQIDILREMLSQNRDAAIERDLNLHESFQRQCDLLLDVLYPRRISVGS